MKNRQSSARIFSHLLDNFPGGYLVLYCTRLWQLAHLLEGAGVFDAGL